MQLCNLRSNIRCNTRCNVFLYLPTIVSVASYYTYYYSKYVLLYFTTVLHTLPVTIVSIVTYTRCNWLCVLCAIHYAFTHRMNCTWNTIVSLRLRAYYVLHIVCLHLSKATICVPCAIHTMCKHSELHIEHNSKAYVLTMCLHIVCLHISKATYVHSSYLHLICIKLQILTMY